MKNPNRRSVFLLLALLLCGNSNAGFREECESLTGVTASIYAHNSCIVITTASGIPLDWPSHCTHFKGGRLLVMANRKVYDAVMSILPNHAWIGMFQYDKSDEPKGNWVWYLAPGFTAPAPYDPIYQACFADAQPKNDLLGNEEDCALIHATGYLYDGPCSIYSYQYACEYENQGKEYYRLKGFKGNQDVLIAEAAVPSGPHASLLCGFMCDAYGSLCFSFAVSGAQCLLYQDTADSTDFPMISRTIFIFHDFSMISRISRISMNPAIVQDENYDFYYR